MQRTGGSEGAEFLIRLRRPQEIAEPAREFPIGDDRGGGSLGRVLEPIQECRRDKDSGERQPEGLVMRQLLFPQPAIESSQFAGFHVGQRTAVGLLGEVDERIDLSRFVCDPFLLEFGSVPVEGLTQG